MKWAKSRKVKNSRSSARSLGTPASGWRAASSETIRGDADPTWWTCSSALGRPAMKDWRLTPGSVPEAPSAARAEHPRGDVVDGQALSLDDLSVDEHRRGGVDVGIGPGLARPLDELVAVGEGARLRRLVVEEQVVELLGDLWTRLVEDHGEGVGGL